MRQKIKLLLLISDKELLLKLEDYLSINVDISFTSSDSLKQFEDQVKTYLPDCIVIDQEILKV